MTSRSISADDGQHDVTLDGDCIRTGRLMLRPWQTADAASALATFGDDEVTRWMSPALDTITSVQDMAALLVRWEADASALDVQQGRWAIVHAITGEVIGGAALLLLPPYNVDLQVAWHLARSHWGHGYATEAGHAVAHRAFQRGEDEVFAVVRPNNKRAAATAIRVGMEWVGETDKYYQLRLDVYRLRRGELDTGSWVRSSTDATRG